MANDFKFGNKAIQDLYFGNKAVLQVYFGDKLIWQKIQKILLTQNDDVVIEYVPSSNREIEHISCFFNPTDNNSTQVFFKIFHESGLVVAQVNSDSIDSQVTELYGLQGQKRIVTLNPKITLRAGEKYYFQYTYNNGVQIKPTYFQGMTGNYKVFRNNETISVANISSLGTYLGYIDDIGDFLESSNGDFMVWNGSGINGITTGCVYAKNSEACSKYYGDLGNGSYSGSDAEAIYWMQTNEVFKWTGNSDSKLNNGSYYRRLNVTIKSFTTTVNLDNYNSNGQKLAAVVLGASKIGDNTAGAKFTGNIWNYGLQFDNLVYTLNSGYSVHFNSVDDYETDPGTYNDRTFYYMIHNYDGGLWLYLNGNLFKINEYNGDGADTDRIANYITQTDARDAVELVGNNILAFISTSFDGNYVSNNFRQATLETTKKFYLEIDGSEV